MNSIYICGPITGMPNLNRELFDREANRLRDLGYSVVNPHDICKESTNWRECMKKDIVAMLTHCDMVALLPGHEDSRGATLEIVIALEVGIEVVHAHNITEHINFYKLEGTTQ